ncbi:MAG: pirin family protein [Candidatus Kapabacteria bacterium]|nr:pirin family protein [Candidatus Kapabacteria bacterium]
MKRPVRIITSSLMTGVGPLVVAQPLPVSALRNADPFLLLHHAGPQTFDPQVKAHRIEPHPHRGFEPVTFVFKGSVLHRDSLGNEGQIGAGEVQWITSGSGIVHSEGPTPEVQESGGELELIQLWVNLPANKKMITPTYQELHHGDIPRIHALDGALTLDVVAGEYGGVSGPATTHSPLMTAMGHFTKGAVGTIAAPQYEQVLLYVLNGSLRINGEHVVDRHHLAAFDIAGDTIDIETLSDGSLLLLAGEPLREPIAMHGPFVMNTDDELRTAFRDFAGGKMGTLVDNE